MKKTNRKSILLAPLSGCIGAILLTWLMLRPVLAGISIDALDLQPILLIWLCCAVCFTMIIFAVTLSKDRLRETSTEVEGLTITERLGIIFQVISLVMMLCIVFDLFPVRAGIALALLLLYLGTKQYMQTRSKMGISFLLWGVAICCFCLVPQIYYWSGLGWTAAP